MRLEPFTTLGWAYQLHYYLCFRTHRRRGYFSTSAHVAAFATALTEIGRRHDYHLLRFKVYPDHFRGLFSLRSHQAVATVVRTLKTNLSRAFCAEFDATPPLWARGYLARSAGRVRIDAVRRYLDQQAEHHGYAQRALPPVFRWRAPVPVALHAAHACFELNHHVVLTTRARAGVFGSQSGEALAMYWLTVADKQGFAIDRISIVPDHLHLLVRTVPTMSIETCVRSLMNNGQYFMGKHFPSALAQKKLDRLWQASAYAGTCGRVTTALVKSFLSQEES